MKDMLKHLSSIMAHRAAFAVRQAKIPSAFLAFSLFMILSLPGLSRAAVPYLVKDINPSTTTGSSSPTNLAVIGTTVYFAATSPTLGTELYKSDGTDSGTVMVKDIWSGGNSSSPSNLTNVNGILFFTATDLTHGFALWKSDGTDSGTVMVKSIINGSEPSMSNLTNVNGTLFFQGYDSITYALWKSDGTSSGTVMVKAVYYPTNLTNVNGTLFFEATDGINGYELWKSDGTSSGTVMVKDIYAGSGASFPGSLTNVNGTLYFVAYENIHGTELWKSDYTAPHVDKGWIKVVKCGWREGDRQPWTDANGIRRPRLQSFLRA